MEALTQPAAASSLVLLWCVNDGLSSQSYKVFKSCLQFSVFFFVFLNLHISGYDFFFFSPSLPTSF